MKQQQQQAQAVSLPLAFITHVIFVVLLSLAFMASALANATIANPEFDTVEVVLAENPVSLTGRPDPNNYPYILHQAPGTSAVSRQLGPASTTKILSAYAMLEWLSSRGASMDTVGNTAIPVGSAAEIAGAGEEGSACYRNYSRCTTTGNCPTGLGQYSPFAALSFSLVRSHNDMASFNGIQGAARDLNRTPNFATYQQWQAQKIQEWAGQTEFQAVQAFSGKGDQLPSSIRNSQRVFAAPAPSMGASPSGCTANAITVYNLARLTQMFVRSFILSTRHNSFPNDNAVRNLLAARSIESIDPIPGQPQRGRQTIVGHTASALFNKLSGDPKVLFAKTGTANQRRVLTSAISFDNPACQNTLYITVSAADNSGPYRFNRTLELINYVSRKYFPESCWTNFTPISAAQMQCQMRSGMTDDERRVALELCQRGQAAGEYFDVDVRDMPPSQVPDFSLVRPSSLPVDIGNAPMAAGGEGSALCDDDIRQAQRNAAMAALQAELARADMFFQPMASAIQAAQCIEPLRQLYRQFESTINQVVSLANAVAAGDMTVVGAVTAAAITVVQQIIRVVINAIVAQLTQQICNATNAAINNLDASIRNLTCINPNNSLFPTWQPINLGLNNSPKQCGGWTLNFSQFAQGGNLVSGPSLIPGMPNVGANLSGQQLNALNNGRFDGQSLRDFLGREQAPPPRFENPEWRLPPGAVGLPPR